MGDPLALPRITFVLGKGGVGRSTVSAALAMVLARRGQHVLVVEWTIAESIAPWFGVRSAGPDPVDVVPGMSVMNYSLDSALRAYFVDHLGLGFFYRTVIAGPHVRRLIDAAPGIAELLFLGQLWWLTTLAPEEAGLRFDRVIVDAPATGHGASLLDMPATLASFGTSGLLALEAGRVLRMMADATETGALVVTTAEDLAVEETLETLPRIARDLGRRPLALVLNRTLSGLVDESRPGWLDPLAADLSKDARHALETVQAQLARRAARERELVKTLQGAASDGMWFLREQLAVAEDPSPRAVVANLAGELVQAMEHSP